MNNTSGGTLGLLLIIGAIFAWIYFEPFSDSISGYWKVCDPASTVEDCRNEKEDIQKLWASRFSPNQSNSTVTERLEHVNGKGPITTYTDCTILDKRNWSCNKLFC